MKKLAVILLAVCILLSVNITAMAATLDASHESAGVVIGASVPETHTITVDAENAEVFFEGIAGTVFNVGRMSTPVLLIRPTENKTVTEVMLNGADVTSWLSGGYITLPAVHENLQLTVMTEDAEASEDGLFSLTGVVLSNGQPLSGITLELHSTPKTCITDENGAFRFDNVEYGHHTLTALKDNAVIGYSEFTVNSGESIVVDSNESGLYELDVPENAKGISMVVKLLDNGKMQLNDVKEVGQSESTPQTGGVDMDNVALCLVLLVAACSGLTILGITKNAIKQSANKH